LCLVGRVPVLLVGDHLYILSGKHNSAVQQCANQQTGAKRPDMKALKGHFGYLLFLVVYSSTG
jgi:hypothetical protein